jgi:hypothetical protein
MTAFRASKTMFRELTDDEKTEVKAYLRTIKNTTFEAIADHFEKRFVTPVTVHCIQRITVEIFLEDEQNKDKV